VSNEFLTVRLLTGFGYARNFRIVRASDALISIDGSNGTLSEAAFAMMEGKSVISLNSFKLIKSKEDEGECIGASSAEYAVDLDLSAAERHRVKLH
jgi:hypothetical protein